MTVCPHCRHELAHAISPCGKPPEIGDYLVCTWCRGISEWIDDPSEPGALARRSWLEVAGDAIPDVLEARAALLPASLLS